MQKSEDGLIMHHYTVAQCCVVCETQGLLLLMQWLAALLTRSLPFLPLSQSENDQ